MNRTVALMRSAPLSGQVAHAETAPTVSRDARSRVRAWVSERFGDVASPVRRGYGVWLAVGAVIAVPEIWAAAAKPPWPTISGTVGHLETRWNIVAVIVVAVIVVIAMHAVRIPFDEGRADAQVRLADGRTLGRTKGGRVTPYPEREDELPPLAYLLAALACVSGGGLVAAALSDDRWILGYVIYGLIAVCCVIVPSALAFAPAPNAPFAGVFATLADLQRRLHLVAVVLLAGLVVLLIHLAFYPWPDVFHHHPVPSSP